MERGRAVSKHEPEVSITVRAHCSAFRVGVSEPRLDNSVCVVYLYFLEVVLSVVDSIDNVVPEGRISTLVQELVLPHEQSLGADRTFVVA